jgi:hypothetical protein
LAFNPFDKEIKQHCFTMSKKYNKLRKAKRRAYYSDMMIKLNSLSDTNPKAFWDPVLAIFFNFFVASMTSFAEMGKSNSFIRSYKELRQHCFTMSKKYNKLRKANRRAYYSDMMFKLNSLSDTNPKAFWDLVNELKYENKSDKGTNLEKIGHTTFYTYCYDFSFFEGF